MRGAAPVLRLTRRCLRPPALVLGAVLAAWASAAAQLALPWVARAWIDGPVLGGGPTPVGRLVLQTAALLVALAAATFAARVLLARLAQDVVDRLRNEVARRLLEASPGSLTPQRTGDVLARVLGDAGAVATFVETLIRRVVGDGVLALGAVVLMLTLDARTTLTAGAALLPLALLLSRVSKGLRRRAAAARERLGAIGALVHEQLRGTVTIRAFQAERFEEGRAGAAAGRYERAALHAEALAILFVAALYAGTGLALVLMLWHGTRLIAERPGEAGTIVALVLYAGLAVEPVKRLGEAHGVAQLALAAADRLDALVDGLAPEPAGGVFATSRADGVVRWDGVVFGYGEGRLLDGVDLLVEPGRPLALVGASGSGKSTLVALLPRWSSPARGHVHLDGVDVRDWRLDALRRNVLVLPQDPFVFRASLLDNLRYGSPGASRADAERVALLAGLHDLLRARGLDAALAEAGRDLSGGQRQRIALARALLRDPAVLVLDEALSALDEETERGVLDALRGFLAQRTVIVVSHRPSTVARFERVAVLSGGRIHAPAEAPIGDSPVAERADGLQGVRAAI